MIISVHCIVPVRWNVVCSAPAWLNGHITALERRYIDILYRPWTTIYTLCRPERSPMNDDIYTVPTLNDGMYTVPPLNDDIYTVPLQNAHERRYIHCTTLERRYIQCAVPEQWYIHCTAMYYDINTAPPCSMQCTRPCIMKHTLYATARRNVHCTTIWCNMHCTPLHNEMSAEVYNFKLYLVSDICSMWMYFIAMVLYAHTLN